jgi:hypothetical protein
MRFFTNQHQRKKIKQKRESIKKKDRKTQNKITVPDTKKENTNDSNSSLLQEA